MKVTLELEFEDLAVIEQCLDAGQGGAIKEEFHVNLNFYGSFRSMDGRITGTELYKVIQELKYKISKQMV